MQERLDAGFSKKERKQPKREKKIGKFEKSRSV